MLFYSGLMYCELRIKRITCRTWTLANISHVNKQLITSVEQDFMHWASNAVDRCWEKSCDWSVAVGVPHSAKSCRQKRELERGPSRLWRSLLSHSQRNSDPPPGSRDALHVHQYTDPIGVYLASVNDSCRVFRRDALELEIQGFGRAT